MIYFLFGKAGGGGGSMSPYRNKTTPCTRFFFCTPLECITASVYLHNAQHLQLAISPSNMFFPITLVVSDGTCNNSPNPQSYVPPYWKQLSCSWCTLRGPWRASGHLVLSRSKWASLCSFSQVVQDFDKFDWVNEVPHCADSTFDYIGVNPCGFCVLDEYWTQLSFGKHNVPVIKSTCSYHYGKVL